VSESRIQGVKVRMTPNKKWDFDYGLGDVQALYRRSEWHNWREAIKWLQEFGEQDNELTPGETVAMVEDLRSLAESRAPFVMNPEQAYKMAHKFRNQNNKRYTQEHEQAIQMAKASRMPKGRQTAKRRK
jgi:hypothetical protein